MGLQSQLNDVGSDSIPLLLVALIASCVGHFRSLLAAAFHSLRLHPHQIDAGIISDHRLSLPPFLYSSSGDVGCIFCLSQIRDGESVRRLPCKHIFHEVCFDGWLGQMKSNCPLCRSPLIPDRRVNHESTERRVASDLAAWFSVR